MRKLAFKFLKSRFFWSFFFGLGILPFFASPASAAYCWPPASGDWIVPESCVFYQDVNGVANGSITIPTGVTLTLHSGKSMIWYPGHSIKFQGGAVIINSGAQIKQTYLCMRDEDVDGYADEETQTYGDTCNSQPGYRRRENITSLNYVDTDVNSSLAYKSAYSYLASLGFVVNAAGNEVRIGGDNLFVCTADSCAATAPAGYGNLIVEGQLKITGGSPGAGKVLTSDASGLASWQTVGGGIPSGMIAFFAGACPSGWSEYTALQGRVVLGNPSGGTVGTTVGTALSSGGTRTITQVPAHTHTIDPPNTSTNTTGSHNHSQTIVGNNWGVDAGLKWGNNNLEGRNFLSSAGSHSHTVDIGAFTSGSTGASSVDVTMPYIQLRGCQKD